MDRTLRKAKAMEETTRFFLEKQGYVPDPDSEEWEGEYRRQFAKEGSGRRRPRQPRRRAGRRSAG